MMIIDNWDMCCITTHFAQSVKGYCVTVFVKLEREAIYESQRGTGTKTTFYERQMHH